MKAFSQRRKGAEGNIYTRLLKYSKVGSLRAVFWRSNLDFIGVMKRLLRRFAPRNDFFRGLYTIVFASLRLCEREKIRRF